MSAPDPKEWAPTATNLVQLGILLHPPYSTVEYSAAREIIERVARRRALAELKALAAAAEHVGGEDWSDCMVGQILIHDRIAEIEAEG